MVDYEVKYNKEILKIRAVDMAVKFVEHLKKHKEVQEAPINAGIPMCKVCNKTIDEIYEEKDTWNLEQQRYLPYQELKRTESVFKMSDIRTFIQKVKEDIENKSHQELINEFVIKKILDKRAGDL